MYEKLTGLQTLQYYCSNKLGYLKDMNIGVDELSEVEAERADLKSKKFIRKLTLELRGNIGDKAIGWLRPHRDLQVLHITARRIPSWLADNLDNLRELYLFINPEDKRHHLCMPCLGRLRSLEHLHMYKMEPMKRIGNEFLGIDDAAVIESFPKLKTLEFEDCSSWEEWDDITEDEENNNATSVFPRLEELRLIDCVELKSLPCRLLRKASSLKRMLIDWCPHLRRRYEKGDEWNFSAHTSIC